MKKTTTYKEYFKLSSLESKTQLLKSTEKSNKQHANSSAQDVEYTG